MWKMQCFRLEAYLYDILLEHYRSLFGTESVRFFDFAALKASPTEFAKQVSEFMNIDQFAPQDPTRHVNPTLPSHVVAGLRLLNNFRMSELNRYPCIRVPGVHFLAPVFGMLARKKLADCRPQLSQIQGYFASSNLRLRELTGIDFLGRTERNRR
jgi:hypothetical protein